MRLSELRKIKNWELEPLVNRAGEAHTSHNGLHQQQQPIHITSGGMMGIVPEHGSSSNSVEDNGKRVPMRMGSDKNQVKQLTLTTLYD